MYGRLDCRNHVSYILCYDHRMLIKKSREQFEMRMKKQLLVAKVQSHELRNKYFWLKRQHIFGAQYEIQFHCKTRLDKDKLQKLLLWSKILVFCHCVWEMWLFEIFVHWLSLIIAVSFLFTAMVSGEEGNIKTPKEAGVTVVWMSSKHHAWCIKRDVSWINSVGIFFQLANHFSFLLELNSRRKFKFNFHNGLLDACLRISMWTIMVIFSCSLEICNLFSVALHKQALHLYLGS